MMSEGMAGTMTAQQREYIADIYDSGKHLLSLIDDILDLSKVEAGKLVLELSEFNLEDLIDASLVMFKEKSLKHDIKVKAEVEREIENIKADERKIKQVLVNLLSNAIKFTPNGGAVSVHARRVRSSKFSVRRREDVRSSEFGVQQRRRNESPNDETSDAEQEYVEITVEDTGIGISPEDQKSSSSPSSR